MDTERRVLDRELDLEWKQLAFRQVGCEGEEGAAGLMIMTHSSISCLMKRTPRQAHALPQFSHKRCEGSNTVIIPVWYMRQLRHKSQIACLR